MSPVYDTAVKFRRDNTEAMMSQAREMLALTVELLGASYKTTYPYTPERVSAMLREIRDAEKQLRWALECDDEEEVGDKVATVAHWMMKAQKSIAYWYCAGMFDLEKVRVVEQLTLGARMDRAIDASRNPGGYWVDKAGHLHAKDLTP